MKEVMAIIRANKTNQTKVALAENGFPAFSCRPVLGRGKAVVDSQLLQTILAHGELPRDAVGESITEAGRLIAKRFFTLIVEDDEVDKVVETIISVNQTQNKGDGKIFVLPIIESYKIRNGEKSADGF
ncbi:MAG: P-II family nitrogen regulator [Clostridia bacterium]